MLRHKNVIALTDIAVERGDKTARRRGAVHMVTPYMDHDLSGLLENPSVRFSQGQIKCYMMQLLEGTDYLHQNHILHRDMKAANLLIDNSGILKIADFGLARMFDENPPIKGQGTSVAKRDYTNCVVTRWYRPPELLLGERRYTCAIDLWGVGCVFGEMYKRKPILPGNTDINQLELIVKLCGSPTDETMPGWQNLPGASQIIRFPSNIPRHLEREFGAAGKDAISLLSSLLTLDPTSRVTAIDALDHDFFHRGPVPARPQDLPKYEASHEIDRRKYGTNRAQLPPAPAGGAVGGGGGGGGARAGEAVPPPWMGAESRAGSQERPNSLAKYPPRPERDYRRDAHAPFHDYRRDDRQDHRRNHWRDDWRDDRRDDWRDDHRDDWRDSRYDDRRDRDAFDHGNGGRGLRWEAADRRTHNDSRRIDSYVPARRSPYPRSSRSPLRRTPPPRSPPHPRTSRSPLRRTPPRSSPNNSRRASPHPSRRESPLHAPRGDITISPRKAPGSMESTTVTR